MCACRVVFVTIFLASTFCLGVKARRQCPAVESAFLNSKIVPDALRIAPRKYLKVVFDDDVVVDLGNKLPKNDTQRKPSKVSWPANHDTLYTLAMIDLDAPTPQNPSISQILHYMVANIRGNSYQDGDVIANYLPTSPPPTSPPHRYVLLVFQQCSRLNIPAKLFTGETSRLHFCIEDFAQENCLGDAYAGNFFLQEGTLF